MTTNEIEDGLDRKAPRNTPRGDISDVPDVEEMSRDLRCGDDYDEKEGHEDDQLAPT